MYSMSKTFILRVRDIATSKTYQFDAFLEKDGNYIDLYVGDTKGFTRLDACIHLVIGEDEEASLADLSLKGDLAEGIGTDIMLKGSLMYVVRAFPHIQRISLQDVAMKKNTNVLLTPKRLLLGKEGWYEARFGAKPTVQTQVIKNWLRKHQPIIEKEKEEIVKPSWGSMEDIHRLSNINTTANFQKLVGTTWDIPKTVINTYPLSIDTLTIEDIQNGGEGRSGATWIRNAKRRNRRHAHILGQIAWQRQYQYQYALTSEPKRTS